MPNASKPPAELEVTLMRIVLFGTQLFNNSNYALCLRSSKHTIFMVPLVPRTIDRLHQNERKFYQNNIELLKELQRRKIQILPIFLGAPDSSLRTLLNPTIFVRDFTAIFQAMRALAPDSIVNFYVFNAIPLAFLKRLFRFNLCIVATGGDINLRNSLIDRLIRKFIYSQSDLVLAVSRELCQKVSVETSIKPVLLSTGADPSFYTDLSAKNNLRARWNLSNKDFVIFTIGNLVRPKGVHIVIEATKILCSNPLRDNVHLLIVGKGPEENNLKKLVSNSGIDEHVRFLGHRSRRELLELYNLSDLFVLGSYTEGLPFSLLEAMACKTICICTPVGDVAKVIKEGYNGFLFAVGDSLELARKARLVMSMPFDQAHQIRENARRTVEKHYDLREISEKMIEIVSMHSRKTTPQKQRALQ